MVFLLLETSWHHYGQVYGTCWSARVPIAIDSAEHVRLTSLVVGWLEIPKRIFRGFVARGQVACSYLSTPARPFTSNPCRVSK
jgi:hypothetical protein